MQSLKGLITWKTFLIGVSEQEGGSLEVQILSHFISSVCFFEPFPDREDAGVGGE